jgi:hypothetical protein
MAVMGATVKCAVIIRIFGFFIPFYHSVLEAWQKQKLCDRSRTSYRAGKCSKNSNPHGISTAAHYYWFMRSLARHQVQNFSTSCSSLLAALLRSALFSTAHSSTPHRNLSRTYTSAVLKERLTAERIMLINLWICQQRIIRATSVPEICTSTRLKVTKGR